MHAKDFVINNCGDCQKVKDLSEGPPYIEGSILLDTLIIEAIDLSDQSGFMVASEEGNPVSIPHFECK